MYELFRITGDEGLIRVLEEVDLPHDVSVALHRNICSKIVRQRVQERGPLAKLVDCLESLSHELVVPRDPLTQRLLEAHQLHPRVDVVHLLVERRGLRVEVLDQQ